ncbi:MAG: hypothetical protein MJ241_05260 [Bacilli bacterium]|nr:hypothetical protein [Bacilli bacterium]
MKKNDIYSLFVYGIMLAIAVVTGLVFVRPTFATSSSSIPLNSGFLFILISVIGSIILNAILIEVGHVIGAKAGGYKIYSVCALWFTLRRKAIPGDAHFTPEELKHKTKFKFRISGYDGLTGETKATPKDVQKSNPKGMIYFPLLFLLVEVIVFVAIIVSGEVFASSSNGWVWWKTFAIVFLAAAFMIHVYNIFPAQLDNKNDGYLFTILTSQVNKEAYNNMLLSEYQAATGVESNDTPVYDKVTDFTSRINDISLYKDFDNGAYEHALEIVEKTLACEKDVSERVYNTAVANKIALLMMLNRDEEAKKFYISQPLLVKKFLSEAGNGPSLRAYILISSHIDESYGETKEALGGAEHIIRRTVANKRKTEEALLDKTFDMVRERHPDWDLKEFTDEEPETEETDEENEKESE